MREATDGVLDHHHRAVHDNAKVNRSETEQAGSDTGLKHQIAREEHRERNRQSHDESGPQVAEEKE